MRLEADGESLLGERSVMEIARELDVDEAFVRKTLDAYQLAPERRRDRQRGSGLREGRGRIVVFLIAAVVAVLLVLLVAGVTMFRFSEGKEVRADLRRPQPRVVLDERQVAPPMSRESQTQSSSRGSWQDAVPNDTTPPRF
jgi:hypothetical protein